MKEVTVSGVQMHCTPEVSENIALAEKLVREAAKNRAQVILLPELFERPYFCQERRYDYYAYAQPTEENTAVKHFSKLAEELGVVRFEQCDIFGLRVQDYPCFLRLLDGTLASFGLESLGHGIASS